MTALAATAVFAALLGFVFAVLFRRRPPGGPSVLQAIAPARPQPPSSLADMARAHLQRRDEVLSDEQAIKELMASSLSSKPS
jgi:hypothetical protein